MKKAIVVCLTFVLFMSAIPSAFAANQAAIDAANALYELGLFRGVGTNADGTPNFDLDRAPTRAEAVTMLVRLLGKDAEAQNGSWDIPFTDVADWAKPYVGYAYANKLTNGVSETSFDGSSTVSTTQYLTFVLRALGYSSDSDFQWDKAWEFSDKIGLTNGKYSTGVAFMRSDVVLVSRDALTQPLKGETKLLQDIIPKVETPQSQSQSTSESLAIKAEKASVETILKIVQACTDGNNNFNEACSDALYGVKNNAYYYFSSAEHSFLFAWQDYQTALKLCDNFSNTQDAKQILSQQIELIDNFLDYGYPKSGESTTGYYNKLSDTVKTMEGYWDNMSEIFTNWLSNYKN